VAPSQGRLLPAPGHRRVAVWAGGSRPEVRLRYPRHHL